MATYAPHPWHSFQTGMLRELGESVVPMTEVCRTAFRSGTWWPSSLAACYVARYASSLVPSQHMAYVSIGLCLASMNVNER